MPNNRFMEAWFDFDIPLDKQVEMFERDGWWVKGDPNDMIKCMDCGEIKNQINFHVRGVTDIFNRRHVLKTCKICKNKQRLLILRLIKENPRQSDNCDCCGKYSKVLQCDHDHITGKFRGWVCINCNVGMGRFEDHVEKLEQAKEYLRRTSE